MNKKMVCSMAALAIMLSCGIAFTVEREKGKSRGRQKATAEQRAWREKLQSMTPEQRRLAVAKRALEMDLASWREVKKIAASEQAVKTIAAIDKIIAAKEKQFKKKLETAAKRQSGAKEEGKGSRKGREKRKGGAK